MTEALVVCRDELAGDSMMCLPAICALAKEYDRLYVAMLHRGVMGIADFPDNVMDALRVEPQFSLREMPVYVFGVAAAISYRHYGKMLNPIQLMFRWAGLTIPAEVPRPRIKEYAGDLHVPKEDVILAPFTTAKERSLTVEQATELYMRIYEKTPSIGIFGAKPNPELPMGTHFYNLPFDYGAELLRRAKVVVTVDSFPGRLAHAAGVRNHITLDSRATPVQTQTYPGCIVMPWDKLDCVAAEVKRLLCVPAS